MARRANVNFFKTYVRKNEKGQKARGPNLARRADDKIKKIILKKRLASRLARGQKTLNKQIYNKK